MTDNILNIYSETFDFKEFDDYSLVFIRLDTQGLYNFLMSAIDSPVLLKSRKRFFLYSVSKIMTTSLKINNSLIFENCQLLSFRLVLRRNGEYVLVIKVPSIIKPITPMNVEYHKNMPITIDMKGYDFCDFDFKLPSQPKRDVVTITYDWSDKKIKAIVCNQEKQTYGTYNIFVKTPDFSIYINQLKELESSLQNMTAEVFIDVPTQ